MVIPADLVCFRRARAIEMPIKCGIIISVSHLINTRTCNLISGSRVSEDPSTSEIAMECGKMFFAIGRSALHKQCYQRLSHIEIGMSSEIAINCGTMPHKIMPSTCGGVRDSRTSKMYWHQ